jgi:hypothetical protein
VATVTFTKLTTTAATEIKAIEVEDLTAAVTPFFTGPPNSLVISNTDSSGDSCTFDLFFTDGTADGTHYMLRSTEIPAGVALVLEGLELEYDTTVHALKAQMDNDASDRELTIKAMYE